MDIKIYDVFSNDEYMGFSIKWSKEGVGTGLLTIMQFWKNGKVVMDSEYMGKEFVKEILNSFLEKGFLKNEC